MLKYFIVSRKNPMNKSEKFYAQLQSPNPVSLSKIAAAISEKCTVTIHDVKAVLSALETSIIEHLRNGDSVRLGDIGSFHATLQSTGSMDKNGFTTKNIKRVCVSFRSSPNIRYQLSVSNPNVQFSRMSEASDEVVEEGGV